MKNIFTRTAVQRYRATHPDRVKDQSRRSNIKWRLSKPERYLWHSAQTSARKRGHEFSITSDDLLPLPKFCPVLGIELAYKGVERGRICAASATVDRRDNARGYVRGNVFVISWRANKLKADATAKELRALAAYASLS